jgi:hypothetical protein
MRALQAGLLNLKSYFSAQEFNILRVFSPREQDAQSIKVIKDKIGFRVLYLFGRTRESLCVGLRCMHVDEK